MSAPVSLPGIPDGKRLPASAASGAASASALDLANHLEKTNLGDSKFPSWVTNDRKVHFPSAEGGSSLALVNVRHTFHQRVMFCVPMSISQSIDWSTQIGPVIVHVQSSLLFLVTLNFSH